MRWARSRSASGLPRGHGKEGGEVNASTPIAEGSSATWARSSWAKHVRWRAWTVGRPPGRAGGDNPPFHTSVFVLTHHAREPLELQGGTTFYFVTNESSRPSSRRAAAGDRTLCRSAVRARGVSGVGSAGRAPRLDRPRDSRRRRPAVRRPGRPKPKLEQVEAIEAPGVTHIRYARV